MYNDVQKIGTTGKYSETYISNLQHQFSDNRKICKINLRHFKEDMSLTNKEIYAMVHKPTITETIRLNRLCWFGYVQRMEGNRIPKRVLYMNLGTRLRGRPRNR